MPGAGAIVRMGGGVPALDDVRLWSGLRTPEQLAAQRSSLPKDATPETLGDCSNGGPGDCAVGGKSCDNDFDCETCACVGAIPKGTCRTNDECTGGATCDDYVPPTQRYAFDDNLLARYEFDHDSYKGALGRAWNTRYRGDPDGVDCIDTHLRLPSAPAASSAPRARRRRTARRGSPACRRPSTIAAAEHTISAMRSQSRNNPRS